MRVDGLFVSYGELMNVTARHDERLAAHDNEIKAMRVEHREAAREVVAAIKTGDEALRKELRVELAKIEKRDEKRSWTRTEKLMSSGMFLTTIASIAALVLK